MYITDITFQQINQPMGDNEETRHWYRKEHKLSGHITKVSF